MRSAANLGVSGHLLFEQLGVFAADIDGIDQLFKRVGVQDHRLASHVQDGLTLCVEQRQGHFYIGKRAPLDGWKTAGVVQRQVGQRDGVLFVIKRLASPTPTLDAGAGVYLYF